MDYSGYSLYGLYPPDLLTVKSYGMKCNNSGNSCTSDSGCPDGYCDNNYNLTYLNSSRVDQGISGITCTSNNQCPSGRICQNPTCTQNSDCASNNCNTIQHICTNKVCVTPKTCRAYPQVDAPFTKDAGELYDNLNLCQESDSASCQCFYEKVEYGQGAQTQYWNYKNSNYPEGVCTFVGPGFQDKLGASCSSDINCGSTSSTPATCSFATKTTIALGLRGYCLEPDVTKPDALNACLTWWPGATTGDPDIYNQFPEAGYRAASNQGQVCANWMTPYGGEIVKECQDGWNQGKSCQNSNPDCPNWDLTDYFPCSLVNKGGWGIDPLVAGKATGFFPDKIDNGQYVCSHTYNDHNPYLKGFHVPHGDSSQTFSYGIINNNALGSQDSNYTHAGLDNITLGMINKIYINVCGDFGGTNTYCGKCNELNWLSNDNNGKCNGEKIGGLCWRKLNELSDAPPNTDIDKNCYYYSAYRGIGSKETQYNKLDDDHAYPTFVFEACFNGNTSSSKLDHVSLKMLRPDSTNGSGQGLFLIVRGFLFQFKSGCQNVLQVADGSNPSPAFTNRVNNKQNYYGASEQLDDGVCSGTITPCSSIKECSQGTCIYKKYSSACQPWGAVQLNGSSPSTFVVGSGDTTCNLNLVAYTSVYKDATPINQNLFIKDYNAWYFDETTFSYLPSSAYDRRNQENPTKSPKVYSVHQDPQTQQYQLGNEGAITVGNTDSQNIDRQGNYVANLKFYGRANDNHMPIRELIIDWGDTTFFGQGASVQAKNHVDTCQQKCCQLPDANNSYYCYTTSGDKVACDKNTAISCSQNTDCPSDSTVCSGGDNAGKSCVPNRKPTDCPDGTCVSGSCLIRGFGDSPEACAEQFWQFSHTYTCAGSGSPGWNQWGCSDACCFKPKVYLKDNWGWCSGVQSQCPPQNGASGGCYAKDNSCQTVSGAGTPFTGRIIIRPLQSGGGAGGQGSSQSQSAPIGGQAASN